MAAEPPAPTSGSDASRALLRRNYLAHLCHGLLGQTGMRLINAPTFVPAYVFEMSGSGVAVGVARGLQHLGMFLSPVLGATLIEHRRRVLPVGLVTGSLMRVQVLGIALAGLLLPQPWSLLAVWAFLALFGFFLGIQGVVFNMLVSKVIPVARRGVLLGVRNALAGITATVVAAWAGRSLVENRALGNGYATTFLIAFGLTSVGLAVLALVREPAATQVREPSRVGRRLRELPALMRSDPAFTRYFMARALATLGHMAVPFYILYAAETVTLSGRHQGDLTAAFIFAQSVGNLAWGVIADRRGFRSVFLASLSVWIAAVLLLMEARGFAGLIAVFGLLGAGLGGFQMSAQNLVLEFGSQRNLPMRIAVANSAAELVAAVGALLGGVASTLLPYVALFWLAIGFQLVGLVIAMFGIDEPRGRAARRRR